MGEDRAGGGRGGTTASLPRRFVFVSSESHVCMRAGPLLAWQGDVHFVYHLIHDAEACPLTRRFVGYNETTY